MNNIGLLIALVWLCGTQALAPARLRPTTYAADALEDDDVMRRLDEATKHGSTTHDVKIINLKTSTKSNDSPQGCGWLNPLHDRMTPKVETEYGEYKWTVAVFSVENGKNVYKCVGSLIHPQVVLSVGHQFTGACRWRVRVGDWNLNETNELYEDQTREVNEVVVHPKFDRVYLSHDIALLFLNSPVTLQKNIGFLCLPPAQAVTPPGTWCVVTGWGQDKYVNGTVQDTMKMVQMPIVASKECERRLLPSVGTGFTVHRTMICAGGEKKKDACLKDGGAPLSCSYKTSPNQFYQAGIVSWGSGCGEEGIPGVYTNVAVLRDWIDEEVLKRGHTTSYYTVKIPGQ